MHFWEIIYAVIVFINSIGMCMYVLNGVEGHDLGESKGTKRGRSLYPPPPSACRKWPKIDIVLDITRKQNMFYFLIFGFYYLLGRKEAKPDYFSEIGVRI